VVLAEWCHPGAVGVQVLAGVAEVQKIIARPHARHDRRGGDTSRPAAA
jgi:hypothetical protein